MRAPGIKRGRRVATLSARLGGHVTLETRADGNIVVGFDGYSVGLGKFSAAAADRAQDLRVGLPLGSFASGGRRLDKEIHLLVRRLATHGLLEYRLGRSRNGEDQVVIEPQAPDYWPQTPHLGNADVLALIDAAKEFGDRTAPDSPEALHEAATNAGVDTRQLAEALHPPGPESSGNPDAFNGGSDNANI